MEILEENKKKFFKVLFVFVFIVSVYFVAKIVTEIKNYTLLGESSQPATISFSGHGEVTAVPDIANVYFTISKDSKTVKDAQTLVATIEKNSLDFLKSNGILEKDIKTSNASFYPKYEYRQAMCPVPAVGSVTSSTPSYYCPPGKQVIVGYTASESITVKVRNTDDVGKIMQGLGTMGVSDLSGPNFAIDNEDGLKAEARKKAIDDAKQKAEVLAKDLGVSLVKITSFSESGNYPMPMYAKAMATDSVSGSSTPAQIPKGENTISSDVTITYEIR